MTEQLPPTPLTGTLDASRPSEGPARSGYLRTIVIGLAVAYTGIDWLVAAAATRAHREATASGAPVRVTASDVLGTLSPLVLIVAYVATGIWLSRARRNADLLAPDQQRWSKPWVWLSWIVPIISYYAPKQVIDDVWRSTVGDSAGPRTRWWWGTWIAAMVVIGNASIIFVRGDPISGNEVIYRWIDAVADTVALVFWISVVRTVSHAQDALADTAVARP
ncbi:MAG: DUF4328 domain-containing protein [Pseudonocardiaceae bacterium]